MTLHRRSFLHLAAGAAALPALPNSAAAQTYPNRPITFIVPFPPGAATDVCARIVADHMSRTLGHQLVVQNVAGAGGTGSGGSGAGGMATGSLLDRLSTSDVTVAAGVKAGVRNWRIWASTMLKVSPVYTAPLANCGVQPVEP